MRENSTINMLPSPGSPKKKKNAPVPTAPSTSDLLHQKAFENSLQASIIFIVDNGQIIRVNKAACKLLGYPKKELLTKVRGDVFDTSSKGYKEMIRIRKAVGSVKMDLFLVKKNGKLLPCEISSVIFVDEMGVRNSILDIVDLKDRLLKQKDIDLEKDKLVAVNIDTALVKSGNMEEKHKDWIKSIARTSYDLIWDWNLSTNLIAFGSNYEKVFGYKLPKSKVSFKEWMSFFKTKERSVIRAKIVRVLEPLINIWEDTYEFTCPDGSIAQVVSRANIVRDDKGAATRIIGVIHDMTKLQKLEEELEKEIRIREKQITEAIVEAKEMERSDLSKELHDNINQLLAASMLYLEMARKDIKNGEIYLIHSSEYTLTAIEEIRKLSKGLATDSLGDFGLCGSIKLISDDTMEAYPVNIICKMDTSLETVMSNKFKLNTYRILQEQVNNIIKHANASNIHITLSKVNEGVMLSIADDGIGFDTAKKSKGIGRNNIISRAELYKGTASFISEPGKGCMLIVNFPIVYPDY